MGKLTPEQRLLSVVSYLLKQEEPVTWNRLREEFHEDYGGSADAAERKWTRDKQSLEAVGISLTVIHRERGTEAAYVLRPETLRLRDLKLTREEAAVLWSAANAAARMEEHPWRSHVVSACDKLRAACANLPAQSSELQVRHGERADRAHLKQTVERIGEAIRLRKRITLEYLSVSRRQSSVREVDVYGFAWRRGTWLFAGYCHTRKEVRVFYVDHVQSLTLNTKRPADHDYEIPLDFDIRVFSRQQPWEFRVHPAVDAEVKLKGSLAPLAEQLLPGGRVQASDDVSGEVRVVLTGVRNLHALARTVLALGPEAELVSPDRGRAIVRAMLQLVATRLHPAQERSA